MTDMELIYLTLGFCCGFGVGAALMLWSQRRLHAAQDRAFRAGQDLVRAVKADLPYDLDAILAEEIRKRKEAAKR